jgi:putative acetyltransferase
MPSAGSYSCRVEVTIRAYAPRDAADLADVFFRSVRQVALSAYTAAQVKAWAPEPRTAEWAHGEAIDGRLVLVAANADDRPVAYIDLEPNGHIDRVFCAPEAAGQGIASRLYDAVEAAAREQGIRSLFTEASELARRLFERKGFAVVERQDLVIRGVAIHNYRMAKALDLTAPGQPVPTLTDPFPRDDPLPGAYELHLPADDVSTFLPSPSARARR